MARKLLICAVTNGKAFRAELAPRGAMFLAITEGTTVRTFKLDANVAREFMEQCSAALISKPGGVDFAKLTQTKTKPRRFGRNWNEHDPDPDAWDCGPAPWDDKHWGA